MFVETFMDYDVGHYHGFFGGYRSTFNPFGEVVLPHNSIIIPTFSPV